MNGNMFTGPSTEIQSIKRGLKRKAKPLSQHSSPLPQLQMQIQESLKPTYDCFQRLLDAQSENSTTHDEVKFHFGIDIEDEDLSVSSSNLGDIFYAETEDLEESFSKKRDTADSLLMESLSYCQNRNASPTPVPKVQINTQTAAGNLTNPASSFKVSCLFLPFLVFQLICQMHASSA